VKVHIDYKSGGEYDFVDVTKIMVNQSRMLFVDFKDGTRHTEDFQKVERIIIEKRENP